MHKLESGFRAQADLLVKFDVVATKGYLAVLER